MDTSWRKHLRIFLIFVPDSPTASLFFCFVLVAFLLKKNWPLIEALAIITLVKYGIWAVVMNLLTLFVTGELHWTGYMLMISHLAMAIEGILYAPYYRFKWIHIVIAAIWTLHNDVIDYLFLMYPHYTIIGNYLPANRLFYILVKYCMYMELLIIVVYESKKTVEFNQKILRSILVHSIIHLSSDRGDKHMKQILALIIFIFSQYKYY